MPRPNENRPRAFVAMLPSEFDLLFSPENQRRLFALADVELGIPDGAAVPVPADAARTFDIIITSWSTRPPAPGALCGARLRLLLHAGGSVRALVSEDDIRAGLTVVQAGAAAMADAVAEFSLTLTLALLRNLHVHDRAMAARKDWDTAGSGMLGRSIRDRRIGIVGLSRTGTRYARLLQGIGCADVVAFDPYADAASAEACGVSLVSLNEVVTAVDVLAVHAPATPRTHHLIGAEQLAALPDSAILVNTARSWVVDQQALQREVLRGRLRAGIDVFDDEPLPVDSELLGLPNVIATPHVAGGTHEARRAQGVTVIAELERHLTDQPLQHRVSSNMYQQLA